MKSKKGFTLLELMIVLAIIAFLAVIALPNIMRFLAKSKRAEAMMYLSSIYTAEKAYWAENGTYSSSLSGEGGIGWKPEGYSGGGKKEKFYYTYGFGGTEGKNFFTGKAGAPATALNASRADANGFTAVAAADIDGDGKFDVITVDQNNNIVIVQDDLAD